MPTTPTKPQSELARYLKTAIFSGLVFAAAYGYTSWLKIPGQLNKSAADTAIILMGLSMVLSSLCYFWNRFDHLIGYRKHLGLVGFAYGIAHVVLSNKALLGLLDAKTWQDGSMWPAFTGLLATVIFTIMAIVSNQKAAMMLGGRWWRYILRTGYIAVIFVAAHVIFLKYGRWLTWYNGGMKTLPALSILVTIFMIWVLGMRVALWWALRQRRKSL